MSTLIQSITSLATRIATECKSIRNLINENASDLSSLTTTAKTSIVAAINELVSYNSKILSRGYISGTVTTSTSGWQKIPFNTTYTDSSGIFSTTNSTFTPTKSGNYIVNIRIRFTNPQVTSLLVSIAKNGTKFCTAGSDIISNGTYASGGSFIVYCDGISDYLEGYTYAGNALTYNTGNFDSYMEVFGPF